MKVKAGEYANVIMVDKKYFDRSTEGGKWAETMHTYSYYAPKVGLVLEEIVGEKTPFRELVEYKPGSK